MTEPTGSYVAADVPGGLDMELERLRKQALLSWEDEAAILRRLGLSEGMSVLELGSGPGFITEQLLAMLPSGRLTALDRDPVMIERATSYLAGKAEGRLEIVEGSVLHMDFPDNAFDFAYARLVFQHLPDPDSAAREVLRVLKPGGRFVIADIDDSLHIFEPRPPEVEVISARFREAQAKRGGNRNIGRRLPRILRDAGFGNLALEGLFAHGDVYGIDTLSPKPGPDALKPLLESGFLNEDEFHMLNAAQEEFYSSDPLVILTILMACGTKPAG